MNEKAGGYHHLTYRDRILLADRLKENYSLRSIAEELNKSPSTIAREIKKNIYTKNKAPCKHHNNCKKSMLCKGCTSINRYFCYKCDHCFVHCTDYTPNVCKKLLKAPYVCNGCHRKFNCNSQRQYYNPDAAENRYKNVLKESRAGFDLTLEEINLIDEKVTPLIKQGLSPNHILTALKGQITISESTLRRLIDCCELTARNGDLRCKVKRKPRKKEFSYNERVYRRLYKRGHLWEDYLAYMEQHPDASVVQMDCVNGSSTDTKALLTLHFPTYHMQLIYLLERQTSEEVIKTLDMIEFCIGTELFRELFPVILTDNGSEFLNRVGLETSITAGVTRTTVFYCEPNRSDEKSHCERNHEHIRYVIPKGASIEDRTQEEINLMMNHINSYYRKSIGNNCPYDMARFYHVPEIFFQALELETIEPTKINLTPSLFYKTE